jgi:hypothetical protein
VFIDGFILYNKYSRKDACRILNWEKNEDSTIFGYKIKYKSAPIFVTYHKKAEISASTKYEDEFISPNEFQWYTKSGRNLNSPDVLSFKKYESGLRIPLFIKKSNDEGTDFYYMGEVTPIADSFEDATMKNDKGKKVSVVKIKFNMDYPVEDSIYEYITTTGK